MGGGGSAAGVRVEIDGREESKGKGVGRNEKIGEEGRL